MKTATFGHLDPTQFPNAMEVDIRVQSIPEVDAEIVIWVH